MRRSNPLLIRYGLSRGNCSPALHRTCDLPGKSGASVDGRAPSRTDMQVVGARVYGQCGNNKDRERDARVSVKESKK